MTITKSLTEMESEAEKTPAPANVGRNLAWRSTVQAVGMLPVLLLICVGFALLNSRFATASNLVNVAQQSSINIVLAAGMTFVILTGGIDLSVGSILAASAMAAVITSLHPGLGMLGIVAGLGCGLALGLVNASLIAFFRLTPFIVTLGALTAVRGLARLMGSDTTIINPDLAYAFIGNSTVFGIPYLVLIAAATIVICWFVLRRTTLGVRIYAVGGNPDAARLSGIRVWRILLFVYGAAGFFAGLGGVMASARLYAANGLQLGQSYELDAIAAVILGGTSFVGGVGSIWGTVVGGLIMAVMGNGLTLLGVSDIWQAIVKGLVIISAVILDRYRVAGGART